MEGRGRMWLVGVLAVGALAFAFVPFTDTRTYAGDTPDHLSVSCGAPVVAAVHGKPVAKVAGEGRVLTPYEEAVTLRQDPRLISTLCRRPARGRVLLSLVCLGAAGLAVTFATRRAVVAAAEEPAPVPT